jgi:hypothetical protein
VNAQPSTRDPRLDALRGLFLMIMAAVHVPTPLSHWLQEPFGYVSSAEGFIFMSASLAGLVYGKTYAKQGWGRMAGKVWRRAGKVYVFQLAVLLPIALIAWGVADNLPPLARHFHDFLQHPRTNLALMPLLAHQPPLFDILPLYVAFLGLTPLVLAAARRCGWPAVLLVSFAVWSAAQFAPGIHLPGRLSGRMAIHSGPFDLRAWQFLWIAGLALGQCSVKGSLLTGPRRFWSWAVAAGIVVIGLLSRHGALPTPPDFYLWMDKWSLGPLRMLNFGAWVVFLLAWNPRLRSGLLAAPALLGRQSLVVFSAHLPLVITASCLIQLVGLPPAGQVGIGLLVVAALFPVALWGEHKAKRLPAIAAVPERPADTVLLAEYVENNEPAPALAA